MYHYIREGQLGYKHTIMYLYSHRLTVGKSQVFEKSPVFACLSNCLQFLLVGGFTQYDGISSVIPPRCD
jgi:hypothetical protein